MRHPQLASPLTSLAVAASGAAALGLGCIHHQGAGVALYEPAAPRRPPADVARLLGPIASVDGRDVRALGRSFELEPGCHVVVTLTQMLEFDNAAAVSGQFPPMTYAFRMKAAHAYVIEHPTTGVGGNRAITWLDAREEGPDGHKLPLGPTTSDRIIEACKAWSPE
jgi:hypothetical protein